ncbi:MAG: hypothetical protein FJ317_09655 [SAR202 cluster bacterium]|nr:hypothetical protein [SAR202 cluster bacterium]
MRATNKSKTSGQQAVLDKETPKADEQTVVHVAGCMHHWVIDAPAGPISKGTCKLCGTQKQFQNYLETSYWGADVSLEQLAAKAGVSRGSTPSPKAPEPDDEG